MQRPVETIRTYHAEFMSSIRSLSDDCIEAALMVMRELEAHDPDPDERCGLLSDRFEVYAIAMPGCPSHRLLAAIDLKGASAHRATLHGVLPARPAPCRDGWRVVARQFHLTRIHWEPGR